MTDTNHKELNPMANHKGTVIQIMGPVLDIRFPDNQLPALLSAIHIPCGDRMITAEVAQHIGDNVVRCIAMSPPTACSGVWKRRTPAPPSPSL